VSASACFPALGLSNCFAEYALLMAPPAAVADKVLAILGHYHFTQQALVAISVTE
jgi:hypothetical protein